MILKLQSPFRNVVEEKIGASLPNNTSVCFSRISPKIFWSYLRTVTRLGYFEKPW